MMVNLQGLRILNTRPLIQNQATSQHIRERNGIAIELPVIHIQAHHASPLCPLSTVDQVIFTSTNAIHHYFIQYSRPQWPQQTRITCIGKACAAALSTYHLQAHEIPVVENSEHLLQMSHLQWVKEQTILLIKGWGGRTLIEETLTQRKAHVIPIVTYRRVLPIKYKKQAHTLWQQDAIDVILFTSSEAMYNLFKLFGEKAKPWICQKPCVVISERLALIAQELGIQTVFALHPHQGFDEILSQSLLQHIKGRTHEHNARS